MQLSNRVFGVVCVAVMVSVVVVAASPRCVDAEILFRDTFEDVPPWAPWQVFLSANGDSGTRTEDPANSYATQAHGRFSFWLYDPDDSSFANARHHVPSIEDNEYMVEFSHLRSQIYDLRSRI